MSSRETAALRAFLKQSSPSASSSTSKGNTNAPWYIKYSSSKAQQQRFEQLTMKPTMVATEMAKASASSSTSPPKHLNTTSQSRRSPTKKALNVISAISPTKRSRVHEKLASQPPPTKQPSPTRNSSSSSKPQTSNNGSTAPPKSKRVGSGMAVIKRILKEYKDLLQEPALGSLPADSTTHVFSFLTLGDLLVKMCLISRHCLAVVYTSPTLWKQVDKYLACTDGSVEDLVWPFSLTKQLILLDSLEVDSPAVTDKALMLLQPHCQKLTQFQLSKHAFGQAAIDTFISTCKESLTTLSLDCKSSTVEVVNKIIRNLPNLTNLTLQFITGAISDVFKCLANQKLNIKKLWLYGYVDVLNEETNDFKLLIPIAGSIEDFLVSALALDDTVLDLLDHLVNIKNIMLHSSLYYDFNLILKRIIDNQMDKKLELLDLTANEFKPFDTKSFVNLKTLEIGGDRACDELDTSLTSVVQTAPKLKQLSTYFLSNSETVVKLIFSNKLTEFTNTYHTENQYLIDLTSSFRSLPAQVKVTQPLLTILRIPKNWIDYEDALSLISHLPNLTEIQVGILCYSSENMHLYKLLQNCQELKTAVLAVKLENEIEETKTIHGDTDSLVQTCLEVLEIDLHVSFYNYSIQDIKDHLKIGELLSLSPRLRKFVFNHSCLAGMISVDPTITPYLIQALTDYCPGVVDVYFSDPERHRLKDNALISFIKSRKDPLKVLRISGPCSLTDTTLQAVVQQSGRALIALELNSKVFTVMGIDEVIKYCTRLQYLDLFSSESKIANKHWVSKTDNVTRAGKPQRESPLTFSVSPAGQSTVINPMFTLCSDWTYKR